MTRGSVCLWPGAITFVVLLQQHSDVLTSGQKCFSVFLIFSPRYSDTELRPVVILELPSGSNFDGSFVVASQICQQQQLCSTLEIHYGIGCGNTNVSIHDETHLKNEMRTAG